MHEVHTEGRVPLTGISPKSMKIHTDRGILQFFPPENECDVPHYTFQRAGESDHGELTPLGGDDVLTVQDASLELHDEIFGQAVESELDSLAEFVAGWNNSVTVLGKNHLKEMKEYLFENRRHYTVDGALRMRMCTWNVHETSACEVPLESLEKLLGVQHPCDLYVFCFQETIPLNLGNPYSSESILEEWAARFVEAIGGQYECLGTNRLLGLSMILIVKSSVKMQFSDIKTESLGTGVFGVWGNKGAISARVTIGGDPSANIKGTQWQFINCHLASGESFGSLKDRQKQLFKISKMVNMNDVELAEEMSSSSSSSSSTDHEENELVWEADPKEESHSSSPSRTTYESSVDWSKAADGLFLCGDLNYRITADPDMVRTLISRQDYSTLLHYDSLKDEAEQNNILLGLEEGPIDFPPTYKYRSDSPLQYEEKRVPSYTDRIFFLAKEGVHQTLYSSINDVTCSDHKPVIADFTASVSLLDFEARKKLMTTRFKVTDKIENDSRPKVALSNAELVQTDAYVLTGTRLSTKLTNQSLKKVSWEVLDPDCHKPATLEVSQGTIEPNSSADITFIVTLPLHMARFQETYVLRIHDSQDIFLSVTVRPRQSFLGHSLDAMAKGTSSIPEPLHQMVKILSEADNMKKAFSAMQQPLDELSLSLLHELDDTRVINQDTKGNECSVAKVFYLTLQNLDQGIVPSSIARDLLENVYNQCKDNYETEEVMSLIVELLPGLRSKVLIFLCCFFKLCRTLGEVPLKQIHELFDDFLICLPPWSKKKAFFDSDYRSLWKRRSRVLDALMRD